MTVDLFKSFTSYGDKIIPKVASDWKMYESRKRDYLMIESRSINQKIDMSISTLFNYFERNNISIIGREIQSTLAIDAMGRFQTEEIFYEWEDFVNSLKDNEVKKSDLMIGESYLLDDDLKANYLGSKYISRLKSRKSARLDNITKISKKYLFYVVKDDIVIELSKEKITYGNDTCISFEKAEEAVIGYYNSDVKICYFKDYNSKNVTYDFIPAKKVIRDILLFKMKDDDVIYSHAYDFIYKKENFYKEKDSRWREANNSMYVYTFDGSTVSFPFVDFDYEKDITSMRIGVNNE